MTTIEKIDKLFKDKKAQGTSARSILLELELSPTALAEWNRGKAAPTLDAIIKLAKHFGVTTDYLLGVSDDCFAVPAEQERQIRNGQAIPHFVAHLDFLNTKKSIEKNSQCLLEKLKDLVLIWSEYIKTEVNKIHNTQLQEKIQFRIFSDNIVMYIPYNSKNYCDALFLICHCCGFFQYLALKEYGMLLRGGLCSGSFYADDSFIYGQALVDSYEIEEKVAIYPRIVVTDLLVEQVTIRNQESLFLGFDNFVVQDPTTRTYYINFLWGHDKDDVQMCRQKIKEKVELEQAEIDENIKTGKRKYSKFSIEDSRISQKNNWLFYYINEYDAHLSIKSGLLTTKREVCPIDKQLWYSVALSNYKKNCESLANDEKFVNMAQIYTNLQIAIRSFLYGEIVKWLANHNIDVVNILGLK